MEREFIRAQPRNARPDFPGPRYAVLSQRGLIDSERGWGMRMQFTLVPFLGWSAAFEAGGSAAIVRGRCVIGR